jgi:hypothetical protein
MYCPRNVSGVAISASSSISLRISWFTVKAAAGNWESCKEEMMLLLDRRGAVVQITELVVRAAAGNWRADIQALVDLADKYDSLPVVSRVVRLHLMESGGNPA